MIEYFDRYSDTDLPDDMGRWASRKEYKEYSDKLDLEIEKNELTESV